MRAARPAAWGARHGRPGAPVRGCPAGSRGPGARAVPRGPGETAEQALAAVEAALADGVALQKIEMLLPVDAARSDLDDWPGGIQQQFSVAVPMVERVLLGCKRKEGFEGRLDAEILDQGDAVGAWTSPSISAVLFPTGARRIIDWIDAKVNGPSRLVLLVNPQWRGGQVISDFGLGAQKAKGEELVGRFEQVYLLKSYRILGKIFYLLRSYPGNFEVYVAEEGEFKRIYESPEEPTFKMIEEQAIAACGNVSLLDRISGEWSFNLNSMRDDA